MERARRLDRLANRAGTAAAERLAAHADGVDLVDEDDALAAPLAREPLAPCEMRNMTMTTSMPMNVCAKPEPGIEHERRVEARGDRLGEHRLAGAGRPEEQQPALALAAGLLELLARLPQRDDARDLLLGLGLAADVVELDAPVGVARLVAPSSA